MIKMFNSISCYSYSLGIFCAEREGGKTLKKRKCLNFDFGILKTQGAILQIFGSDNRHMSQTRAQPKAKYFSQIRGVDNHLHTLDVNVLKLC